MSSKLASDKLRPLIGLLPVPNIFGRTIVYFVVRERGGLVINASDFGSRGRGFEPHSGQTVLCP